MFRGILGIVGALTIGASVAVAAPKVAAGPHYQPQWHVVHRKDSFEDHIWVGGAGQSGNDSMVASCDDENGMTLLITLDRISRGRPGTFAETRTVILKAGDGTPLHFVGREIANMVTVSGADRAAQVFADNQLVGVRVKFPNRTFRDGWFQFSPMDKSTRQMLLACSQAHRSS